MPLDSIDGEKTLQLITSRFDQREWRKKIEKLLGLPPSGLTEEAQRKIFLYLKNELQAYKSRRADPPSWIVGGYATREVVDRARYNPTEIDPSFTKNEVAFLGEDPGSEVDQPWFDDILIKWFLEPGEDEIIEESEPEMENEEGGEAETVDDSPRSSPGN